MVEILKRNMASFAKVLLRKRLRVKIPSFTGLLSTDSGVWVNYKIDTNINDPVPTMTTHSVYANKMYNRYTNSSDVVT